MTTAIAATVTTKPATAAATGLEPTPGSPEALLLLAGLGVLPANAGNPDPRFSPEAISACIHRLLEVKQQQELLGAEQKEISEQLRLAHLRGDLAAQLPAAGKDGTGYQVGPELVLNRRPGRRQWSYSLACAELDCQLKARQAYEQQSGDATCSYGAAFWELRSVKS